MDTGTDGRFYDQDLDSVGVFSGQNRPDGFVTVAGDSLCSDRICDKGILI